MNRIFPLLLAAGLACVTGLGCGANGTTIQGAGATFPEPLYKRWFLEYYKQHPDVRVNYQAIGSGAGVRQFTAQLVDFGASDSAMSDKEIKEAEEKTSRKVQLLPMTAGSVVLCYNLPGAPKDLKLSRKTYPKIFLGEIQSWDDDLIKADNPGVALPNRKITVCRRSDGSGTTFVFTNHLNTICDAWKQEKGGPGVGKSVQWGEGIIGGRGNPGVAALVQQTEGAIGYLEFGYADLLLQEAGPNGTLGIARLENRSGKFIQPSMKSGLAGLAGVELPENLRVWIPDPAGADAYPIVTFTWLLCYRKYDDPAIAQELKNVIRYCLTDGQKLSEELGYIPLPEKVQKKVLAAVDQIE